MRANPATGAPPPQAGMQIGLLGGSFNPAHGGHLALSTCAITRLNLHQVWWIVAPQNPLKETHLTAPYNDRLADARHQARHPAIIVSDIERRLGTCYTIDTVTALQDRNPGVRFILLLGADNLLQLPHWRAWQRLIARIPLAIMPRPPFTRAARTGKVAQILKNYTLDSRQARRLATLKPPALVFLDGPENPHSSTALRETGK